VWGEVSTIGVQVGEQDEQRVVGIVGPAAWGELGAVLVGVGRRGRWQESYASRIFVFR
jgi:hypothetical protein